MVTIDFGLLSAVLGVISVNVSAIVAVVKVIQRLAAVERRLNDMAGAYKVLCRGV